MKILLRSLIMFGMAILYAAGQLNAEEQIIRVRAVDSEWPPICYHDKDGKLTGTDVEIARALVETAGFKAEFVSLPWVRGVMELENGGIDLIPEFGIKEERKEFALWIGPTRNIQISLIVKKGNETLPIKSLDDIVSVSKRQNMKFGYQRGSYLSAEFNNRMENDPAFSACFDILSQADLNLKKTLRERIIGFFEDRHTLEYSIKNDENYSGLAIHPFFLDKRPTYFGISKKSVDVKTLSRLYEAYEKLITNGTIQHIRDKR